MTGGRFREAETAVLTTAMGRMRNVRLQAVGSGLQLMGSSMQSDTTAIQYGIARRCDLACGPEKGRYRRNPVGRPSLRRRAGSD